MNNSKKSVRMTKNNFILPCVCMLMTVVCALFSSVSVPIEQFGIEISGALFTLIYAAVCTVFLMITKRSSITTFDEIIRSVIIVEIFINLRSLHRDLILPVLLTLLFISVYSVMFDEVLKVNKVKKYNVTKEQKKLLFIPACRVTCAIMSVVLLFSSVVGVLSGTLNDAGGNILKSVSIHSVSEKELADELEFPSVSIKDAKELGNWDNYDKKQKQAIQKKIMRMECERLGISGIKIAYEDLENPVAGYYSDERKTIVLGSDSFDKSIYTNINIVCHECFHAYQYYTVEHTDFYSEEVQTAYYYRQVRLWKNNINNYISSSEDEELYRKQPLEADAYAYGDKREFEYEKVIYTVMHQ